MLQWDLDEFAGANDYRRESTKGVEVRSVGLVPDAESVDYVVVNGGKVDVPERASSRGRA